MKQRVTKNQKRVTAHTLGIIADDLTGAMDSSGYFARRGLGTVVLLEPDFSTTADVLVINTNSRAETPAIARERASQAVRNLPGRVLYKKIDSTLRGNIGIELEATMKELSCDRAIVAPAFPEVGRTTVNGELLVDGARVTETQFARDPTSPVKEAHIPTLLEQSTGFQAGNITVEDINSGAESLYRKISRMPQEIIVCDVTEQSHLTAIARAAALAGGRWLLCGSGGLARELHLLIGKTPGTANVRPSGQREGPALVIVGTRNQVAANQLTRARDELGFPILNLEGNNSEELARIVAEARHILDRGKGLALSSTFSRYEPALKKSMPAVMAEATAKIPASQQFGGLFLSGGDIAVEVCRHLSVAAILVHGEVEPGIPAGELIGGQYEGTRVVTKAGGFGTDEAIIKAIAYLEKGKLP
ncbi:four-carbon acid sugar kinase family protein [Chloroflexota bacterium]